ncbi:MAG TPA: class I SAM-dependent methyltransferase [Blastocatellia bacterium]|nr:class I SAM-dependent methyltransferase [Blastocatellia bacterium]
MTVANERLDYGLDAPGFPRLFAILAVITAVAAVLLGLTGFGVLTLIVGVICAWWTFCAAFWILGCKFGKLRARDAILSRIEWHEDERVLDIGCGHGLLLMGAAKRLTTGRAIGIDIWSQVDQWDNRPENTARNARIEGVADRVEIRDGDARKLDFPNESFDVVVSSAALHNIREKAERDHAIREIIRVLKPGGQVAIYDMKIISEYQQIFLESGMEQVRLSGWLYWYLPFAYLLTAVKPRASRS